MRVSGYFTLLTALALAGAGCKKAPADGGPGPGGFAVPVATAVAVAADVPDILTAVGAIEANEIVTIKPEVEGRIVAVEFEEGQRVERGAVLFRLDDAKLAAARASADARAARARANLERGRRLFADKTIAQQEFDEFEAEARDADGQLTLARERLADATIVSPLTGYATERLVSVGQVVERERALVTVVDSDPVKIDFTAPERQLAALRVGQTVEVTTVALPGRTFTGEVYFIEPRVDPVTRTVKLKAKLANPDGALRPGMFAHARLTVGTRQQAVLIPEQAVVAAIDKLTVFVVEEGVARRRAVTTGARLPGQVEILSGVAAGETVIASGHQKVQDGFPVMPLPPPDAS